MNKSSLPSFLLIVIILAASHASAQQLESELELKFEEMVLFQQADGTVFSAVKKINNDHHLQEQYLIFWNNEGQEKSRAYLQYEGNQVDWMNLVYDSQRSLLYLQYDTAQVLVFIQTNAEEFTYLHSLESNDQSELNYQIFISNIVDIGDQIATIDFKNQRICLYQKQITEENPESQCNFIDIENAHYFWLGKKVPNSDLIILLDVGKPQLFPYNYITNTLNDALKVDSQIGLTLKNNSFLQVVSNSNQQNDNDFTAIINHVLKQGLSGISIVDETHSITTEIYQTRLPNSQILSMAASSDLDLIATGLQNGFIIFNQISDGTELQAVLSSSNQRIYDIIFSENHLFYTTLSSSGEPLLLSIKFNSILADY